MGIHDLRTATVRPTRTGTDGSVSFNVCPDDDDRSRSSCLTGADNGYSRPSHAGEAAILVSTNVRKVCGIEGQPWMYRRIYLAREEEEGDNNNNNIFIC